MQRSGHTRSKILHNLNKILHNSQIYWIGCIILTINDPFINNFKLQIVRNIFFQHYI